MRRANAHFVSRHGLAGGGHNFAMPYGMAFTLGGRPARPLLGLAGAAGEAGPQAQPGAPRRRDGPRPWLCPGKICRSGHGQASGPEPAPRQKGIVGKPRKAPRPRAAEPARKPGQSAKAARRATPVAFPATIRRSGHGQASGPEPAPRRAGIVGLPWKAPRPCPRTEPARKPGQTAKAARRATPVALPRHDPPKRPRPSQRAGTGTTAGGHRRPTLEGIPARSEAGTGPQARPDGQGGAALALHVWHVQKSTPFWT